MMPCLTTEYSVISRLFDQVRNPPAATSRGVVIRKPDNKVISNNMATDHTQLIIKLAHWRCGYIYGNGMDGCLETVRFRSPI